MYSRDELFTRSSVILVFIKLSTKITLSWAHKQLATPEHILFYMFPPKRVRANGDPNFGEFVSALSITLL